MSAMATNEAPLPGTPEWLDQGVEDVIDPSRAIIDPHHHLWPVGGALPYGLDDLHTDTDSGHQIEATVFIECGAGYRADGPAHLRSVGETAFVAENAAECQNRPGKAPIAGIVATADLRLGAQLDEVLDAHADAGGSLFKGIRQAGASDSEPEALTIPGSAPVGLYDDPAFREGVARLGERGLTYDTWHYHHQNADFARLAAAVPGTTLILDHFGTPLGVGRFTGQRDALFDAWKDDIAAIAANPNVVAKLGGLAMPDNGFGWHERDRPASSDELVEQQAPYYLHAIECFGPERCMFESNFPVDRFSISYRSYWNAAKKIAADFDDEAQEQMFRSTAKRIYRL